MSKFAAVVVLSQCDVQAAYAVDAIIARSEEPLLVATEHSNRTLQITPYMWAAGLKGNVSPFQRAPTIGVEKSFSDVMHDLNFGGFINVWGRYDQFVLSGDIMYVDTTDGHAFGPLPPLPIPLPPGTLVNGHVDSKQFMTTWQGGYRVIDMPKFTFDALGGARFWRISNDVTVNALGISKSYGESFGWIDPTIGARAFFELNDKLSFQAQMDIGGFGAGSDLTWAVLVTVNYVFTDHLSASAGYKVLKVNYDRNGHVYDTRLSGPALGVTYRF